MTKGEFLTVRWNNLLSLGLGIPALIYAVFVLSTSVLSDSAGFIGFVVIGVVYWIAVEQHANMRFAWLKKNSPDHVPVKLSFPNRLIHVAYNVVWWIPIVLPFTKTIDYRTGFLALAAITVIRGTANLYRNNVLTLEQAERFPFRAP